jgi:hypothetical protein
MVMRTVEAIPTQEFYMADGKSASAFIGGAFIGGFFLLLPLRVATRGELDRHQNKPTTDRDSQMVMGWMAPEKSQDRGNYA